MSNDGLFILREKDQTHYYYERHGATGLASRLIGGLDALLADLVCWKQTDEPYTAAWVRGAVLVDLDQQYLLYWGRDLFFQPVFASYYHLLLRQRWVGWEIHWAAQASIDFASALAQSFPEQAEAEKAVLLLDWQMFLSWQEGEMVPGKKTLSAWVESYVDPQEVYYDSLWITVRWIEGGIKDYLLLSPYRSTLALGSTFLSYLRSCEALEPLSAYIRESYIWETLFIDEQQNELFWWGCEPAWVDTVFWTKQLWEGWRFNFHDQGPRYHLQLSGRAVEDIRGSTEERYELLLSVFQSKGYDSDLLYCLQQILRNKIDTNVAHELLYPYHLDLPESFLHALYALACR